MPSSAEQPPAHGRNVGSARYARRGRNQPESGAAEGPPTAADARKLGPKLRTAPAPVRRRVLSLNHMYVVEQVALLPCPDSCVTAIPDRRKDRRIFDAARSRDARFQHYQESRARARWSLHFLSEPPRQIVVDRTPAETFPGLWARQGERQRRRTTRSALRIYPNWVLFQVHIRFEDSSPFVTLRERIFEGAWNPQQTRPE
jgi:hypothetical protein